MVDRARIESLKDGFEFWDSKDPATGTQNYYGARFDDYIIAAAWHRQRGLLDRVNFDVTKERLEAALKNYPDAEITGAVDPDDDGGAILHVGYIGHWAVGQIEYLFLHYSAPDAVIEELGRIKDALADYPILDENRYSEAEIAAIDAYWENLSEDERDSLCAEHDAGDWRAEDFSYFQDDGLYDCLCRVVNE